MRRPDGDLRHHVRRVFRDSQALLIWASYQVVRKDLSHGNMKLIDALRYIVSALVLLTATSVFADTASVRAVVDRNQVAVGESIALQITVENGKGDIDLTGLTDFKTHSRGSTSSFQMINGRTSRQMIYNYVLIPLRPGNLTLPAIPVKTKKGVLYTQPIAIAVSKEPPPDSGRRDVYVTAEVSETSPWVGQQMAYTFRVFNAVQIAEANFQAPAFNGFSAQELEDRRSHRTVINGRDFMVTEVRFILVPLKAGTLEIDPAILQVGLLQRSRRPRPFSGMDAFFGRTEMTTRMLEADGIAVDVKPLPATPPGSTFSGLVGSFDVTANLEKADIRVGDSTTLTVSIKGSGNIMDAPSPVIPVPEGFKSYADNPETQVQAGAQGYTGSKTFRTALVPVQPGQFHIDPIVLTYFDVAAGEYRNVTTSPFALSVSASENASGDIDVFRATPLDTLSLKKQVDFTGRDILPLKADLDALESRHPLPPYWFALFIFIPVIVFLAAGTMVRMRRSDDTPQRVMAERARQALKAASTPGAKDAEFLSSLYRALVSAIHAGQGAMGTSLTWSEAKNHLSSIGWDIDEANAAAELLESIESFNYSGESLNTEKRAELLERTRQAVRRLVR
jgi:hypothetical protein